MKLAFFVFGAILRRFQSILLFLFVFCSLFFRTVFPFPVCFPFCVCLLLLYKNKPKMPQKWHHLIFWESLLSLVSLKIIQKEKRCRRGKKKKCTR